MAKIHTVEWTPAILDHPTINTALHANWWGFVGEKLDKLLGHFSKNEYLQGIPGSGVDQNNVPYSLTEEFVSVYRLHPLIPGKFFFNLSVFMLINSRQHRILRHRNRVPHKNDTNRQSRFSKGTERY
jgi:hypothetical protein